jgi:NADPH:quinone reductase-like Zn-dependent oxidoreductase
MATTTPTEPALRSRPAVRAVVQDRYGSAESWVVTQVPLPEIGPREVLVAVRAAGLDRGTWHLLTGRPYLMRVLGFGFRRPKNRVAGLDVAGVVTGVGADVTQFAVGDEVCGISRGAYTDFAVAREDKLVLKPANCTFEQAAVLPISGLAALQAVRDTGGVQAGSHVLVIGASGGVGSYAVQIAKALGAEVTGVASSAKADLVRSLGADHVLDYARDDITSGDRTYDVVLDIGGNMPLRLLRRAVAPRGTLVVVGGENGGRWTGGIGRTLRAVMLSPFVRQRLTMQITKETHVDLAVLSELVAAGSVRPAVDRTYPLELAADAMRRLEAGAVRGKVAIAVAPAAARAATTMR